MANKFQTKRTTISGRTPNTTNSGNTHYIDTGELALNLTDGKLFSSNGTTSFEVGANLTNASVTNILTVKAVSANGSNGTAGQVLTSNGTSSYWSTVSGGGFTNGQSISVANLEITGGLTANGSTGTSGQILASNGTSLYWTTQSSGSGAFISRTYTGTGACTNFTVTNGVSNNSLLVMENGIVQTPSTDYSVSGTTLTFTTAPANTVNIQIRELAVVATLDATNSYTVNNLTTVSTLTVGNSTVNSIINSTSILANTINIGGSSFIANSSQLTLTGIPLYANGSAGIEGQVLHSNGTTGSPYWAADDNSGGTVTQVDTGNGLTGGPITGSGTISVVANNGIISNSSGVFANAGTGIVANATGIHVNSSYIATISANSATYVGGNTALDLRNYSDTKASDAYTNATSFASNADNISSGTLNNSRLPGSIGLSTTLYVGNSTVNTAITPTSIDTDGTLSVLQTATFSNNVQMSNNIIANVADPVNPQDAANKQYVDAFQQGLHIHQSVHAATTDTLATLTGGTVTYDNGTSGVGATLTLSIALTTLDSYTLVTGDRILVKNQANTTHNGIYTINSAKTVLTRATDFDSAVEIHGGDFTFVTEGTSYNSTGWVQVDEVNTVGTDPIVFQQFSGQGTYTAGNYLYLSGSQFNANASSTSTASVLIARDGSQNFAANTANLVNINTDSINVGGGGFTANSTAIVLADPVTANGGTGTAGQALFSNGATGSPYWDTVSSTPGPTYVQNTDSRTLSGNLVISGTYFNPSANTVLLGNSTQRWVVSANTVEASGTLTSNTVILRGSAASFTTTISPGTPTANRIVTLPNETFTVGFRNIPPVGTKTSSYTLATSDVGKYVQVGSGGSIRIPDATFAEGDAINIFNNTAATITIFCDITTAYGAGYNTPVTQVDVATRGMATILFISSTVCVIAGNIV